MITVQPLELPEVLELTPRKFGDNRGFFSETYNRRRFAEIGIATDFVQDNQSFSAFRGTLRGMHYQLPPHAQEKLVRVVKGAILDVVVDIRRSSPKFGKWTSLVISAKNWKQVFVPKGFAHGFITLEPDTEVVYKVSDFYSPEHDRSIRYDDPAIGIDWVVDDGEFHLSQKDMNAPLLAAAEVFD